MLPEFSYLFEQPTVTGNLRTSREDFFVDEELPFEPSGEGEHLFIHIEKVGANTGFVAKELSKYFKVKENLVSYAGLKDRFAVTRQWFGVHLPGKTQYDLSDLAIEGVSVISQMRHHKKLKIGALTGNHFKLTLRDVNDTDELQRRWVAINTFGVPNYFGEQRFGINGGNIEKAQALFDGQKVKDKKKRGMYLSAARSLIFNAIVSERVKQSRFDDVNSGDVCMLAGTQSVFIVDEADSVIKQRLQEKDIDITAPMWGAGELMTQKNIKEFESTVAEQYPEFVQGLPRFGLNQERRRIRLNISHSAISIKGNTVEVSFFLPAGAYATTVMRELIDYKDLTERVVR